MKKNRSSNYELLRIFAMLMIIFFHVIIHWSEDQLTIESLQNHFNNGFFSYPIFSKKLLIISTAMPMGLTGNGLFIMISGYFMSDRENINLIKISKKILTQLGFATLLLVLSSSVFYIFIRQNTDSFFTLEKITDFNSSYWWFIGYYYVIVLISSTILNKILINSNKHKYFGLMIGIFSLVEIGWSGGVLDSLGSGLRTIGIGLFYYMLGGYIKKYDPFKKINTFVLFIIIICLNLINWISSYNDINNNIQNYIKNGSNGKFFHTFYMPTNYDILVVIFVITIFEIFKRIKIPSIAVINYIGSSTFMIYLIHENGFFQSIYNQTDCITILYNHPIQFIILMLRWTIICFCVGLLAYILFDLTKKIFIHKESKQENYIDIIKAEN